MLLLVEQEPCAKTCASLVVRLEREAVCACDSMAVVTSLCDNSRYESGVAEDARTCPKSSPTGASQFSPARKRWGKWEIDPSPVGAAQVHIQALLTPWRVVAHGGPEVPENNVVSHAALLCGMRLRAEVVRSWTQRKPVQSAGISFELRAAW